MFLFSIYHESKSLHQKAFVSESLHICKHFRQWIEKNHGTNKLCSKVEYNVHMKVSVTLLAISTEKLEFKQENNKATY